MRGAPARRCPSFVAPVGLPDQLPASRARRARRALHASAGRSVPTYWLLRGDAFDATCAIAPTSGPRACELLRRAPTASYLSKDSRIAIYRGPLPNYKAPTTQSPRMLFAASECGTIGTDPSMLFAARNDMKPIIARRPFFSSASCLRLSDSADIAPDKFAQS